MSARDRRLSVELSEDDVIEICDALTGHAQKFEELSRRHIAVTTRRRCVEHAAKLRALALTLTTAMIEPRRRKLWSTSLPSVHGTSPRRRRAPRLDL
jgi:hypothetical protein